MGFFYFVNVLNVVAALIMIGAAIVHLRQNESTHQELFQYVMRYTRFFLVYALMANRFNRYRLWEVYVATSDLDPIPYWPLTRQEIVVLTIFAITLVASLVGPRIIQRRWNEPRTTPQTKMLHMPLYPAMLAFALLTKGIDSPGAKKFLTTLGGCIAGTIYTFGWSSILVTLFFSYKNVH